MKLGLRLFLLLILCQCGLQAQNSNCATVFSDSHLQHFLKVKKNSKLVSQRSKETIYVPIKFHAVADAEGNGRVRFEKILDQLCELNENFEPLGFSFYLKDGEVNEVDNNTIYSNPSSAAGTTKMVGVKSEFGKNALNIFITDNAGTGTSGQGTTLGYYDFNQDLIVLKKSVTSNNNQVKFVLGHEVGHFFSLPHTFNGWDSEPWDGNPVSSTLSPNGILNELADSSNCDVAGDMICDTPADYNLGFGWDGCRDYDGGCTDPTGALLDPEESNFMGYFIGCDEYFFSPEQQAIILSDYLTSRRSYLRVNYTPSEDPIAVVDNIVAPEDDATTPFFNGVHVEWEPSENATHYLLELTQTIFKSYYVTDQPSIFLTDLAEEKTYRWRVKAFSELLTCTDFSASYSFKTGNMISSIEDEVDLSYHVRVYPNPSDGQNLNIDIENKSEENNVIKMYDLSGRLHYSGSHRGNYIKLENLDLSAGLYLLQLKNGNEIITKKVVVEK